MTTTTTLPDGQRSDLPDGQPSESATGQPTVPSDVAAGALPGGPVHPLPDDLASAIDTTPGVREKWLDITPLARNEFICWVEDAKQAKTRERRIRRTGEELLEGLRRPCCWPGCSHRERTGKA